MAGKDYYGILGVSRTASEDEIKSAYKKLAKQWHPDVNTSPNASEKFKEINEAYSALSDSQKRQTYDQFGSEGVNQGFSGGGYGNMGGFDFSDFFSGGSGGFGNMDELLRQAFGGEFRTEGGRRSTQPLHIRTDIEMDFEEAAFGTTKTIRVHRNGECPSCQGTGSATKKKETCPSCKGRGMQTHTRRTPFGMFQTTGPCSTCGGTGQTVGDPCTKCRGKGIIPEETSIEVTIPAGVDTGNHLRIPKQGHFAEGKRGDVHVVLHVRPHPQFKRDGYDIYLEQPIPYADAVLGGDVEVPILGKKTATLHIPPHTRPGTVFRLKGNGIRVLNENGHGDQYVKVEIAIPEKVSPEERDFLERMRTPSSPPHGEKAKKGRKKGLFGI
ncbi:MAG: molecular chaperone DnaJ [archaeon]